MAIIEEDPGTIDLHIPLSDAYALRRAARDRNAEETARITWRALDAAGEFAPGAVE